MISSRNNLIPIHYRNMFRNLPKLEILNLSHQNVNVSIRPKTFRRLPHLTKLELSYCNISSLPDEVFIKNNALQELLLDHNGLEEVNE